MAEWIPGQPTEYYEEGGVYQADSGTWFVRENGDWRPMTSEEVTAWLAAQP